MPVAEKLAPELSLDQLVGATPEFRSSLAVAAKAARNRLPILIVGEPGTGKETFARPSTRQACDPRSPLVALDCKAVPANIVDSELFGHEAGAFPGAFAAKDGKMVAANGGTLLLDDITALPAETQEALDRTLATGEVRPVGCNGSRSVDVRLIATSSRPLARRFRAAAPRAARKHDRCPPAASGAEQRHSRARPPPASPLRRAGADSLALLDNDALAVLMRYGWPGNVRQLASVLLRAGLNAKERHWRRGFSAHRDTVPLLRPRDRHRSANQQAFHRRCHERRRARSPCSTTTGISVRSTRSRRTSSGWRSAIIAAE
jgi:DNA-binding NtrC family response regulator